MQVRHEHKIRVRHVILPYNVPSDGPSDCKSTKTCPLHHSLFLSHATLHATCLHKSTLGCSPEHAHSNTHALEIDPAHGEGHARARACVCLCAQVFACVHDRKCVNVPVCLHLHSHSVRARASEAVRAFARMCVWKTWPTREVHSAMSR